MASNLELNDRHLCPLAGSVRALGMMPVLNVRVILRAVVDTSISYDYQMISSYFRTTCGWGGYREVYTDPPRELVSSLRVTGACIHALSGGCRRLRMVVHETRYVWFRYECSSCNITYIFCHLHLPF